MNANYTYAKSLDELSDVFRSRTGAVSATDVQNLRNDYGPSDFDIRHRVVVSYNYDLPIFRGNRLLGGWTVNGIVSWNTGAPIGLFDASSDGNKDGTRIDRPIFVGGTDVSKAIVGKTRDVNGSPAYVYLENPVIDLDTGAHKNFETSASCLTDSRVNVDTHGGFWCNSNLSRGAIHGPGFTNVDFGVSKTFKINERMGFRFDANFFDLLNHPNFRNPDGNFGNAGTTFGQSLATTGDQGGHRITQLAVRFDF